MDPAARVPLGRTGLTVTRLGLGLAPIAGLYAPVGDEQARATVDRAWDRGVRLFDTAPRYGYGLSERRAGAVLAHRPRAGFVLATKVGWLLEPGAPHTEDLWAEYDPTVGPRPDFSAAAVPVSLAGSLDRLGLDRVDLVHIHDPDQHYEAALHGTFPALAELRGTGRIRAIGVGMNQTAMLARFVREAGAGGPDCVLVAGRYTLLDQSAADDLLPLCARRGVAVIVAGVYNSGVLAGPAPGARYNYRPAPPELLARAAAVRAVCDRHAVPLRAAALRFPFRHPAVTAALVGARSPAEVDDNADLFGYPVPDALWADLAAEGLVRS